MGKEKISNKEGIVLIALFIMGSTLAVGVGGEAGRDAWISIILGVLLALPIILVYGRILNKFPGKNLFDIFYIALGRGLGTVISLLYIWFAFHLGALVLRNYGEFINTVSLIDTPQYITMGFFIVLCIWGVKAGIEIVARWSKLALNILIILVIAVSLLQIPNMEIDNLRPTLLNGFEPILSGVFSLLSFPLLEIIVFVLIFSSKKNIEYPNRALVYGLIFGGIVILSTTIQELLVLGHRDYLNTYFPSYRTVSRIDIGGIIQRVEIIVSTTILAGGFVKITICLLGACTGITRVFNLSDYRFLVTPLGLLMLNMAYFLYGSLIEMVQWAFNIWPYYAFIFQVILPVLIFIVVEIKTRKSTPNGWDTGSE